MSTLASLVVKLTADTGEFGSGMNNAAKKTEGLLGSLGKSVQNVGKLALGAGAAVAVGLGAALVTLGPLAISAASDFEESLAKVQVVFADSADSVEAFSQTAALSLGITQADALAAAGTFGNLFRTMGLGEPASAQMSTDLITLAADLASFNNIDPTEVLDKLRSGLVGETEPLRALGINLTDAAVRAQAMAMGLAESEKEVSQAAMTQARFALIMEQSALAQGDFARTSDGLANTQRMLKAVWGDMLQKIGLVLLPILMNALEELKPILFDQVIPAIEKALEVFDLLVWGVQEGVNPFKLLKVALSEFLPADMVETIIGGLHNITTGIQDVVAYIEPYLQTAGEWISNNVQLSDVLIALGIAIAAVVVPAIASVVVAAAPVVLTFVGLVAVVAALRAAWETDFLGVRTALQKAWGDIQPVLETLWMWLETNIPIALEVLSDYWTGTLLPAIEAVWDFTSANIFPLLTALNDVYLALVSKGVEALAGVWENVWLPSLKKVATFISDTLGPILEALKTWLTNVTGGVDGITSAIQTVIGWLSTLADKIREMDLPDWLTPGSPTPFELGLRGIADATRQLARVELPAMQAEFTSMSGGMRGSGRSTTVNAPVTISANVAGGLDIEDLAWRVSNIIGQRVASYA